MHWRPALLASAQALPASAFLLPPEVSTVAQRAKAPANSLLSTGVAVKLDCPGCPFFGADDITQAQHGVDNQIFLDFQLDPGRGLTLNGRAILPPDTASAAIPFVVSAPQIRTEDGQETGPVLLQFALERLQPIASPQEPGLAIVPVRFTVLGLQGYPVKVDTVALDLVQTPDTVAIARFSQIPFDETPGATSCDGSSQWSFCRLRAIIASRLQDIMEAAKAHTQQAKGWVNRKGGCMGKTLGVHGTRPHGDHHHSAHKGHRKGHHLGHHKGGAHNHRARRIGHMLHQIIRFFVVPALLGVIGGLLASAVGMIVGRLISYLWVRFHRNNRRRTTIHVVELLVDEDEKVALALADDIPPPEYADIETAPAHEKD